MEYLCLNLKQSSSAPLVRHGQLLRHVVHLPETSIAAFNSQEVRVAGRNDSGTV
jgi:hypothetical protein